MSRQRVGWLALAALVALSLALYLSARRDTSAPASGGLLVPGLSAEANSITQLSLRRASATPNVTVQKQGANWTVAQRADYPADVSKVRKLVLALADAKIVEEKTADPAKFAVIGVEDPTAAGAGGAEVSVTGKGGKRVVIVGKSAGAGNFARRGGETRSYVVEPAIPIEADPKDWLDTKLIDIPTSQIRSVEIKPASGAAYSLHRVLAAAASSSGGPAGSSSGGREATASAGNDTFTLEGVPAGRKAAEASSLAPSPSTLSALALEDVTPAANVDFTKPTKALFTLTDGSTLSVTGASSGDKHWILLNSSRDAALNAKASGRAFEIAGYRYDSIFRPLEQLLVPKPSPPAKAGAAEKGENAKSAAASPRKGKPPLPAAE